MTPEEQGRHCTKCSKTVFDVENWSDEEVLSTYEENNKSLCIRIPSDRLASTSTTTHRTWKYYLISGLAFFMLFVKKTFIKAQTVIKSNDKESKDTTKHMENVVVNGVVKDTLNGPSAVAYANVYIKKDGQVLTGTISDTSGKFELNTQNLEPSDTLELVVESIGYEAISKKFTPRDSIFCEIILSERHICLNEMVINVKGDFIMGIGRIRTSGIMVSDRDLKIRKIIRPLLDEYDTKSIHHDELERYNLGR